MFTGGFINENTFIKVINGLNETIGVVLEYLQDAKVMILILLKVNYAPLVFTVVILQEHGQTKGNDLLASVRLVGRCVNAVFCIFFLFGFSMN